MKRFFSLELHPSSKNDLELQVGEMLIENGSFNWEDEKYSKIFGVENEEKANEYILDGINIHIEPGDFVAVVGKVGSGKSSLLLSLMNEMVSHEKTKIRKNGSIAYISQEAFLSNDTIMNNILFGQKYDAEKFRHILECC